ncbi:MAG: hypothetical protein DRJ56_02925 [Thermoprotei archaeon]|nr:MAG: hypothetical protein DRJ56_02925 [Thermoprotei archaeon]
MTDPVTESAKPSGVVAEALSHDSDLLVLFVSTWIEAPSAVAVAVELPGLPVVVWGLRMYYEGGRRESTGSLPGACVLKASLESMGRAVRFVVGMPDEPEAVRAVYEYSLAASAAKRLKRSRVGLVGYASMGMYTATFDPVSLRAMGPDVVHIDTPTGLERAQSIDDASARRVAEGWRARYHVDSDVGDGDLATAARLYLAFKGLAKELGLDALTVKCQYEFSKGLGFVPCLPLSILADEGLVCSCEGDVPLTVTMLALHYLTGQPIYYGDVVDVRGNRVYLSSCGFAPLSLARSPGMGIGKHKFFFRGLRSGVVLREGPVTLARLGWVRGEYVMHVAPGVVVETELRQGLFPAAEVELRGSADDFLSFVLSQHYALAYGDLVRSIRDLCAILGVECVVT